MLRVFTITIAVLIAIVAVTAAAIVVVRVIRQVRRRKQAALAAGPRRRLLAFVADNGESGGPELVAIPDEAWRAAEAGALGLLGKLRGEAHSALVSVFLRRGTARAALRDLRSRSRVRRARAAQVLGDLELRQAVPELCRLLTDRHDTIGEDAELVVRLHHYLRERREYYRVIFVAEPVSWSEAPSGLRVLGRQRRRWHRGIAEILSKHRRMIGNPRYGRIGLIALPYYVVFELLAPFVELSALVLLPLGLWVRAVDLDFACRFALVAYGYGLLVSLVSLFIEEVSFHRYPRWSDLWRGVLAAVGENFGYRQILAVWQVSGAAAAWRGRQAVWGSMHRQGFDAP